MIDSIQNIVQPIIVELLLGAILAVIAWAMRLLPERLRVDVEARHRDALHRALDTAVGLVIDTLQRHPSVAVPDAAVTQVIRYVKGSVPDAIKRLGPSQAQLEAMATAKLQSKVDEIMGRDKLAAALQRAGLDAVEP